MTRRDGEPSFDIFKAVAKVEWDILFFFCGIIFRVGGLAFIGCLELAADGL